LSQKTEVEWERTRLACRFPRPRGKPRTRRKVPNVLSCPTAQGAGREARPAAPEGGCAPQFLLSGLNLPYRRSAIGGAPNGRWLLNCPRFEDCKSAILPTASRRYGAIGGRFRHPAVGYCITAADEAMPPTCSTSSSLAGCCPRWSWCSCRPPGSSERCWRNSV
jgi:hypothetical protein